MRLFENDAYSVSDTSGRLAKTKKKPRAYPSPISLRAGLGGGERWGIRKEIEMAQTKQRVENDSKFNQRDYLIAQPPAVKINEP